MITAINPKHQQTVNRFIRWDTKYNEIVDQTDDSGSRAQETAYNNAAEALYSLPKREKANLAKLVDLTGY